MKNRDIDAIKRGAERGLTKISEIVERDLKQQVPVVTGRLQRSIDIEEQGKFLKSVGSDLFYAQYVEKYKSYTEPVLLKDEDIIADIIIDEIMKEIEKGGN